MVRTALWTALCQVVRKEQGGRREGKIQRYLIARLESLDFILFILLTLRHVGCKLWACLELDHLGSDSGSANSYMCNLGQIMKPLCLSFFIYEMERMIILYTSHSAVGRTKWENAWKSLSISWPWGTAVGVWAVENVCQGKDLAATRG